jgi:cytoskeleton protein RodZ
VQQRLSFVEFRREIGLILSIPAYQFGFSTEENIAVASFGEGVKREREKKKITLDQVSVSTKISARMLRAIEEEKFDQLPGGIFNKAFVRTYARYLGLDEEKIVADYMAAAGGPQATQAEDLELRAMAEQKEKKSRKPHGISESLPWGWIASLLLVTAVGVSVWGWYARAGERASGRNEAERTAQGNSEPRSGDGSNKAHYQPSVSKDVGVASAQPAVQVSSDAFTLLVKAEEDSWALMTADGNVIYSGMLVAPEQRSIKASKSITIRAGNVGGLTFIFNGRQLKPQGDYGEVKSLSFGSEGLQPEAADKPEGEPTKDAQN